MRFAILFVIVLVCLVLLAIRLPTFLVNTLAFHPSKAVPPEIQLSGIEEVFFEAKDGVRLQAFVKRHSESDRLVLFFHGNAGNVYGRLHDLERLSIETASNVVLLSYRGYAKSEGRVSEAGVYLDAEAALIYARDKLGFDEQQIFILGRSLGSAVAVNLAQHRDVAGLMLVSPFTSGRDMAGQMGLGWLAGIAGKPLDSISKITHVNAPALFIHGDSDRVIPIDMGRRLFEMYPHREKTFHTVQGAGHNNITAITGASYWMWMRTFMDEVSGPK